jgi:hypothetical protein
LGAALVGAPRPTLAIISLASLITIWLFARGELLAWDLFGLVLGGLTVLGYGFANIPAIPAFPIPLADVLLVGLGLYAILTTRFSRAIRAPLLFWALYFTIATARLIVDYGTWGTNAVRDYTIAVELVALPVGYWSMRRYGLARWLRLITVISSISLIYAALFPFRGFLMRISPSVGLQQPVPLMGFYSGAGVALGFFAFLILRPLGRWSLVGAALFLPAIAIQQSRGMFIAVPLAAFAVFLGSGRRGINIRHRTIAVAALGATVLTLTFVVSPQGRLGPTDAQHVVAMLETLNGGDGPGAGTYRVRTEWFSSGMKRVQEHHLGWATGLGLGPDLANGFRASTFLVRKPHDDYFEAYARLGIFGLAALVGLIITATVTVFRAARGRSDRSGDFLWWVVAVSVVYAFIAVTQPLFAYAYGTVPLFAALGAGLALVRNDLSDEKSG